jgi:hypothetical protein
MTRAQLLAFRRFGVLAARVLLGALPLAVGPHPAAAQGTIGDTVHVLLVGRNETAQVYICGVASDSTPRQWQATQLPVAVGVARPVLLRNDLAVQIGKAWISPGRYRLWTVGADTDAVLILTAYTAAGDTTYSRSLERARVPLVLSHEMHPVRGTQVFVVTTRNGSDTVGFTDRSTKYMQITRIDVHPGSTSELVIRIGDIKLTAPIAAK